MYLVGDVMLRLKMRSEKGFSLIEVIVALAIIGVVAVGFLSALTSSSRAAASIDVMDTARTLAQGQIEYIKQQPFQATGVYQANDTLTAEYPGYSVTIPQASAAAQRDTFIQKITIIVSHAGKEVIRLEDFKVKR